MMAVETPPLISLCFGQIQIYVPRNLADIARARKLLEMLEVDINGGYLNLEGRQNKPQENQPYSKDQGSKETLVEPPSKTHEHERISNSPTQTDSSDPPLYVQVGQTFHTVAHGVIASQIEAKPISTGEQRVIGTQTSKPPENAPERILSNLFIPKFEWDKTKEKSYRTIFFFEHEDGRVMISYMLSRTFTMKDVVLALPYPIPRSYALLQALDNNKRTAFRFYREYLAKEAASHELVRWKDKNNEDILLHEAENKDEDEIVSDAAKEAEANRLEKLRKAAEVNKDRWKDRVETEMSARTKELRRNIVLK